MKNQRSTRFNRRGFIGLAAAGLAASKFVSKAPGAEARSPELAKAIEQIEPYLTSQSNFRDVSRGKPIPHSLPDDKKAAVGLTRDSWKLQVISDPENPATLRTPATLDFDALMKLSQKHAIRFPKVMTCLNIGCPLGMGIWEGVPLREIISLTQPKENLRRVFYYGYHNDDPAQMFRSSLPVDRILEDLFDLPPVILCYKLNGEWLNNERGGPVRMVVPEGYGFKCVKWLSNIVLSNLFHANDTYADGNNNVESWLKSFAASLSVPTKVKAGEKIPVTGYAQAGLAGISKVQVSIRPNPPTGGPDEWVDAEILPPPKNWGEIAGGKIPTDTFGFDSATHTPKTWPMRLTKIFWAALLPGLPPGNYTFRCRTVDEKQFAQPQPRPFKNSGHAAIETIDITVA